MPISMKKYVDIKSATNTTRTATEKELIARIFLVDDLLPLKEVWEFEDLADVREFFGIESTAYKIASKYFGFINKYARSPKKISFYNDMSEMTTGFSAFVRATKKVTNLSTLTSITSGSIGITINEETTTVSSIDLSSATSFAEVVSTLNTAFSSASVSARCDYVNEKFIIKHSVPVGVSGTYTISVTDTDLSRTLCLSSEDNPIVSTGKGYGSYSVDTMLDDSYQISNNFATFMFASNSTEDDTTKSVQTAEWLKSHPSEFMFVVRVKSNNYSSFSSALANYDGVSLELGENTEETGLYNPILPMAITATTDYNKENGTVNYMYTQDSNMKVVVDDDENANTYDNLKINYYGRTQQAGQKLAFYQNGVLQGNFQDQNVFVNEIWLKDALTTKFFNYMLLTPNWYANQSGQAIGQGLIADVIERAKLNGTITTEKEMSEEDKVYIYNITSDENAWRQIYQEGYYLITSISKEQVNNQDTYQFNYTLLYSKGDSIKKVEGYNILI